jgi:uncharacterized membrane protein
MAIGPVQLVVLGFDRPGRHDEIVAELERLRATGTVRVIDALVVHKTDNNKVELERVAGLTTQRSVGVGSMVGAFVGMAIGADGGPVADLTADDDQRLLLDDIDAWDVLDEIPPDSVAALILLEHQWATPLRDAVARAGGFRIADGLISPSDLIAFGVHTAEEAEQFEGLERSGTTTAR